MPKLGNLPSNNFIITHGVALEIEKDIYVANLPSHPYRLQRDIGGRNKRLIIPIVLRADANYPIGRLRNIVAAMVESGEAIIIDATDLAGMENIFGIGYVVDRPPEMGLPNWTETRLTFQLLPPWGFIYTNTGIAELWDLERMTHGSRYDPTAMDSVFKVDWVSSPKKISYEVIAVNTGATSDFIKLETCIPNALASAKYKLYSWNGTSYVLFADAGAATYNSGNLYYLDGQTATTKFGSGAGCRIYDYASTGAVGNPIAGDVNAGTMTYSNSFGTSKRFGYAIKFPASTGSRAVTGSNAANKVRLKIEIFFDDEYTSYQLKPSAVAPPMVVGESHRGPVTILAENSNTTSKSLILTDYTGAYRYAEFRQDGGMWWVDSFTYQADNPSGDESVIFRDPTSKRLAIKRKLHGSVRTVWVM
jgi:hypothetical protein